MGNQLLNRPGTEHARIPKVEMMKKDPAAARIISQLVRDDGQGSRGGRSSGRDAWRKLSKQSISRAKLERLSRIVSNNIDSNTNVMELLPDAKLASNIWQSVLISPNDFGNSGLAYDTTNYPTKNIELSKKLIEVVKAHFQSDYKIEEKLPQMVDDILFRKGSWVYLVLSQSSLDNVINGYVTGGLESIKQYTDADLDMQVKDFRPTGILGPRTKTKTSFGLEDLFNDSGVKIDDSRVFGEDQSFIRVTDNTAVLSLHNFNRHMATRRTVKATQSHQRRAAIHTPGMEANEDKKAKTLSLTEDQIAEVYDSLYKNREYRKTEDGVLTLPRDAQYNNDPYSHPLVHHVPSEAVIPVHVPGDNTVHVGYYLLLDEEGNFLKTTKDADYYQDLMDLQQKASSEGGGTASTAEQGVIAMAQQVQSGGTEVNFDMREFYVKYVQELERDLITYVANGTYGKMVSVTMSNEISRVMWARTCRKQGTRVLYVPAEAITYMAFDYNRLGIGASLLDQTKMYTSARIALMLASVNANLENSINHTELGIRLEEEDTDPEGTIEDALTLYFNSNTSVSRVVGMQSPADIMNLMAASSTTVKLEGSDYIPSPDMNLTQTQRQVVAPSEDIQRFFKNQQALGWYLKPQWLDSDNDVQFATEMLQDAEMMVKQCIIWQKRLCVFLADFMRKYALKSGALRAKLVEEIQENKTLWQASGKKGREAQKKDKARKGKAVAAVKTSDSELNGELNQEDRDQVSVILTEFIASIDVSLPRPEVDKASEKRRTMVENQVTEIQQKVDAFFPDNAIRMILPTLDQEGYDSFREDIRRKLLRDWMIKHNMADDILPFISADDETRMEEFFQAINDFDETMATAMLDYVSNKNTIAKKFEPKVAKLTPTDTPPADNVDDNAQPADDNAGGDLGFDDGALNEGDNVDENNPDGTPPADNVDDENTDEENEEDDENKAPGGGTIV